VSDWNNYADACIEAALNRRAFDVFRQNPAYTKILEHVTEEQGGEYLKLLLDGGLGDAIDMIGRLDIIGGPRKFLYGTHDMLCPTTLRYAKVMMDLFNIFGDLDNMSIAEVGVGYGGQCRIVDAFVYRPSTYLLVDIWPALALARRFLEHFSTRYVLTFRTMNELPETPSDLFISNYAFTELPCAIQDVYLERLILKANRGYITYNEVPFGHRSYSRDELLSMIHGACTMPEEPLTGPGNCIIYWGS
jgi:hypothetical protein